MSNNQSKTIKAAKPTEREPITAVYDRLCNVIADVYEHPDANPRVTMALGEFLEDVRGGMEPEPDTWGKLEALYMRSVAPEIFRRLRTKT